MADPPGSPWPHANCSAYPELLDDVKLEEDTEVNYDNPFQVADVLLGEAPLVVSPTDQTAPANVNLPLNLTPQLQANAPADNPTNGLIRRVEIKPKEHVPAPSTTCYVNRDCSIENLENGRKEGLHFLDRLRSLFQKYSHQPSENRWFKQTEELCKKAVPPRVIIGVVGTTGAGKSSLINALLDEERLVPTNSMRACTAVVTEISFNHAPNRYRAEIEFISLAEWEEELKLIFGDIELGNQQKGDNSDSAIARAKTTAVYPDTPDILKSSIKELLVHENVSNVLGKTIEFAEDDPIVFYTQLQKYVDSKTKTRGKGMKGKSKTGGQKDCNGCLRNAKESVGTSMEFWPLIRIVRLYVRAPVLATGAAIVDLPGMQDANAARAAVASRYIEQCSSLWIVAPITRAVDDKTAKTLLSNNFQRQIQMDGTLSAVTFICSKTDDINLSEMVLDFEDIVDEPLSTLETPEISTTLLQENLEALKDERNEIVMSIDDICEEMAAMGCSFSPLKGNDGSPKRNRPTDYYPDFIQHGENATNECGPNDNNMEINDDQPADSEEKRWCDASNKRKRLSHRKKQIDSEIKQMTELLNNARENEQRKQNKLGLRCIVERNQTVKAQIRQDFTDGVRQLDEANVEEESFDPSVDLRDYDQVARALPVFCVSSKAYQKLKGRLRRDHAVKAFCNTEETEIPALQAHCLSLTVAQRKSGCQSFLNGLQQLMNSLDLLCSISGSSESLCEERKENNRVFLQSRLDALQLDLENLTGELLAEITSAIKRNIFDKFGFASSQACNEVENTLEEWHRSRKISPEGLAWNTYKAICRRQGVYKHHDWNSKLIQPMMPILAASWERSFSRLIPKMLSRFAETSYGYVKALNESLAPRLSARAANPNIALKLKSQLTTYQASFKEMSCASDAMLNQSHKAANRAFVPIIAAELKEAYKDCGSASESAGQGVYIRMKNIMTEHVQKGRHEMFRKSTEHVQSELEGTLQSIRNFLALEIEMLFQTIRLDYENAFEKSQTSEEKALNKELKNLLRRNTMFNGTAAFTATSGDVQC
ncbi:conserved hypothetical protein [Histoplasma capsulatum var. duboisii H88]|uniref:Tat pathway signal sequence n=1 Tax=Ajellomyces capsulatus (strain H88) TaxID=544711 RepID=F0U8Z9_AJEC8|nr:conserved hypothetical protein [Histoplasma capsulatum var. duboisii H88]